MTGKKALLGRIVWVGIAMMALVMVVQAHTHVEKTDPKAGATLTTAPTQIQLWFNEKIDPAVSKIELSNPSGKVELGPAHSTGDKTLAAAVSSKLAAGAYTVAWQTAGDDGHVVKGNFKFSVGGATH